MNCSALEKKIRDCGCSVEASEEIMKWYSSAEHRKRSTTKE
jgi:hypothetical protein